jgi:hypothetical protein
MGHRMIKTVYKVVEKQRHVYEVHECIVHGPIKGIEALETFLKQLRDKLNRSLDEPIVDARNQDWD